MPITLITGNPGAGKTLYAVQLLMEKLLDDGRPIYTNIDGLNVDHPSLNICDKDMPYQWRSMPDNAIFIFDEIQEQYPRRNAMAKVPDYIAGFETHRQHGFDFYIITQSPSFLDKHVIELVTKHIHLYRYFGLNKVTVYSWNLVNLQPNPAQTRATAVVNSFKYPRHLFKHYKSATMHTVKAQLPLRALLMLGGCVVGTVVCVAVAYSTLFDRPIGRAIEEKTAELERVTCALRVVAARPDTVLLAGPDGPRWVSKSAIERKASAAFIKLDSAMVELCL